MSGTNKGQTYAESFGTTSPVTGDVPSDPLDGQPLDGLAAITVVVSAPAGATLSGAGTLDAYLYDQGILTPDGAALANGGSGISTTAFLAYGTQTGNFHVGVLLTGATSGATGTISADTDAGATGVLTLTGVTGVFQSGEVIADTTTGSATTTSAAYKTLAYDNPASAFEVGQVVTGGTSGAKGTISALTNSVLTFDLSTVTGVFVDDEVLVGASQPRWVRASPSFSVSAVGRDEAFSPVTVATPRKGRIKWVPNGVTHSGASGGISVHQLGQTNSQLHDQGKWGG